MEKFAAGLAEETTSMELLMFVTLMAATIPSPTTPLSKTILFLFVDDFLGLELYFSINSE